MVKRLTHFLVRKTIANHQNTNDIRVRARYGMLEAWVSIAVNLILFVIKLSVGITAHSVAIVADAFHTLSDTGTSIVILIGFKIAKWPADREHPFGHGQMESVAALIVAVLLMVTGLEIGKSAFGYIIHPRVAADQLTGTVFMVIGLTVIIKEITARFAHHLGVLIQSQSLEADSRHHRSDVYSTLIVMASMLASRFGVAHLDGIMGLAVAAIIVYSGIDIARQAVSVLLGQAPDPQLVADIETAARAIPGVQGVHEVIVHQYGTTKMVSLHVEVTDDESANRLHDIAEHVEDAIAQQIDANANVIVHIDPLNKTHERYEEIESLILEHIIPDPRILSFHDLRLLGHGARLKAAFNIVLKDGLKENQSQQIAQELIQRLRQSRPLIRFAVNTEASFSPPPKL